MKRMPVSATEYPRFEVMFGYYPFDDIDFLKHRHLSRRRPSLVQGTGEIGEENTELGVCLVQLRQPHDSHPHCQKVK